MIGHPNGLPMKFSPSGTVRAITDPIVFSHNVDSFKVARHSAARASLARATGSR